MNSRYYMINPRSLRPIEVTYADWQNAFAEIDPRLARSTFELPTGDQVIVSTIFVGIDNTGEGLLFTTGILGGYALGFKGDEDNEWQYRTALEAARGHRSACSTIVGRLARAGVKVQRHTEWPPIGQ